MSAANEFLEMVKETQATNEIMVEASQMMVNNEDVIREVMPGLPDDITGPILQTYTIIVTNYNIIAKLMEVIESSPDIKAVIEQRLERIL